MKKQLKTFKVVKDNIHILVGNDLLQIILPISNSNPSVNCFYNSETDIKYKI